MQHNQHTRGDNVTVDSGASGIFGQSEMEYLKSPKVFHSLVATSFPVNKDEYIIVNSVLTVHIIWRNG